MDLIPSVLAHEIGGALTILEPDLTQIVAHNQRLSSVIFSLVLLFLTGLAIAFSQRVERIKPVIFIAMVLVILFNTVYLVTSTLQVNFNSVTKGPVHWHADFEIWNCGVEVDLADPKAPSNRVGTPLLHEHNDKRIHVEEAVYDLSDVSLSKFFEVVGGDLHQGLLAVPTNEGLVTMKDGEDCPNGMAGTLQAFLYSMDKNGEITQRKLSEYEGHIMNQEAKVPPGNCVIFEFESEIKETTDKMCLSYRVEKEKQSGN